MKKANKTQVTPGKWKTSDAKVHKVAGNNWSIPGNSPEPDIYEITGTDGKIIVTTKTEKAADIAMKSFPGSYIMPGKSKKK